MLEFSVLKSPCIYIPVDDLLEVGDTQQMIICYWLSHLLVQMRYNQSAAWNKQHSVSYSDTKFFLNSSGGGAGGTAALMDEAPIKAGMIWS